MLIKKRGLFVSFLFVFLTIILCVAASFSGVSAAPDPGGGVAPVKTYTIEEKATRWTYYRALSYCVIKANLSGSSPDGTSGGRNITISDMNEGNIFENNLVTQVAIGSYFGELTEGWDDADESLMRCSSGGWVKKAFLSMGLDSMNDVALSLGFEKLNSDKGIAYWHYPAVKIPIADFRSLVAYYGNPELTYDDAVQYYQELRVFSAGCIGKAYPSYLTTDPLTEADRDSLEDKYEYNIKRYSAEEMKLYEDDIYEGIRDHDRKVWYRINIDGDSADNVQDKCINILNSINSRIDDYKKAVDDAVAAGQTTDQASGETEDGGSIENGPTCGSVITTGIGWIVCPVISTLTALNDSMWSFVENLLFVNPISKSNDGVYKGWVTIRNISNVFFVIAFLVIIFSQLSGFGISNYGVKKLLPRIIVVAIAINLSFIVMQVAIDATNIIGKGLYDAIYASSPTPTIGWADALKLVLEGSGIALGAGAAALVILGPEAALLALLPILLSALVSFLAAALTLIFRQAIIPILAMIAPLAFIANLLPNTEQWFKKWSKLLLNMLMLYPMAALVFAGARFASSAIIGEAVKQGDTFNMIIGLIVLSLPLFSLPFLSRQGAPMLAKVSGALGNLGKRITSPIDNFSKEVAKNARVRSDNAAMNAENPGVFRRARRGVLQYRARRNAVNQNQQRELNRSQTDYVAGEVLNENSNLAQQMAAGSGSGADSRAKASATKAQDDIFKSEKEAEAILQRGMARGALKLTARGGAGITEAQQAAAFEEIMKTGNLEERQEMLSTLTPDTSQRIRSIAEAGYYARGDHKIFGPQLGDAIKAGSKATGEGEGRNLSIEEALLAEFDSKMIKGSFSASALASDKDVAKKVASQFTGLSEDAKSNLAKQAQTALAMPTAQDLDAEHRASLQAMIDGANPTRSGLVDKRGNPL